MEEEVSLLVAGQQEQAGRVGRWWWRQRNGWHVIDAGPLAHMTSSRFLHWHQHKLVVQGWYLGWR